ncbi:hypothetical protein [Streptomyces sp. NPDC093097]
MSCAAHQDDPQALAETLVAVAEKMPYGYRGDATGIVPLQHAD